MEFVNIDLLCNKLDIQLRVNDSITYTKKSHILEIEDETDELLKATVTKEKKTLIK